VQAVVIREGIRFAADKSREQRFSIEGSDHASHITGATEATFESLDVIDGPGAFLAKSCADAVQVDIDHDIPHHGDARPLQCGCLKRYAVRHQGPHF
jgi:hypothetical protein